MSGTRWRGDPKRRRRGFTLVELLVVITIIGMLMAMMFPALSSVMGVVNQNRCQQGIRSLGTALMAYKATFRTWPAVSTEPVNATPASAVAVASGGGSKKPPTTRPNAGKNRKIEKAKATGYSWIFQLLPNLEQEVVSTKISVKSANLSISPFHPDMTIEDGHVALRAMKNLKCPVYDAAPETPPEYAEFLRKIGADTQTVAPTNFVALAATHMTLMAPRSAAMGSEAPNGVITASTSRTGTPAAVPDGDTRTLILVESREAGYNSWIDGSTAWVVGADPNSPDPIKATSGRWECKNGCKIALNVGPDLSPDENTQVYYRKVGGTSTTEWAGAAPWKYGPSSMHPNQMVTHLSAGNAPVSLQAIGPQAVDGNVYMALITRNGHEPDEIPTPP